MSNLRDGTRRPVAYLEHDIITVFREEGKQFRVNWSLRAISSLGETTQTGIVILQNANGQCTKDGVEIIAAESSNAPVLAAQQNAITITATNTGAAAANQPATNTTKAAPTKEQASACTATPTVAPNNQDIEMAGQDQNTSTTAKRGKVKPVKLQADHDQSRNDNVKFFRPLRHPRTSSTNKGQVRR